MIKEKTIKILQYIIYKCSDCPLVQQQNSVQVINGQAQQISVYGCSRLKVKVLPNEIYKDCKLNDMNYEVAEYTECKNINIIKTEDK